MEDHLLPIHAISSAFIQKIGLISPTARDTAELAYALVYSATKGRICLREDQILAAVHFHEKHDTVVIARTGGGKTMQIVAAALLNPGKIILVMSPLKRLQDSMVREQGTI